MSDDDIDFYDLLEIDEDASQEEVKQAFRAKVREYHPDLNDDPDAPAQFNALKKAYETLDDSSERNAYDRLGHKDYVAKRIGGFPSGDIWGRSSGNDDDGSDDTTSSRSSSSRTTGGRSSHGRSSRSTGTRSSGSGPSSGSSSRRSRSASSSSSSSHTSSSTRTSSTASTSASTPGSSSRASPTGATGASTGGGRTSRSTDSTIGTASAPTPSGWTDNALFNWWNNLSLGWPLMLSAVLLYLGGLAQFGMAYSAAFSRLVTRVSAAGTDTAALTAALAETRYGLAQPATFVAQDGALVTDPPLPTRQWYAALGGLVAVTILLFGLNRAFRSRRPYKWVTINETVGVSLAAAISAGAYGGPLLAGVVVMPVVYLVIVRHTRMAFQFKPTYLYVVGVSAPVVGLALDVVGVAPALYVDLVTLSLPIVSVVVLLLSAFVRPKVAAMR